jgi:hypothetical protein
MPSGKKRWLRPISELKGGEEPFANPQTTGEPQTQEAQLTQLQEVPQNQEVQQSQEVSQTQSQTQQSAPVPQPIAQSQQTQQSQQAPQMVEDLEGGNMDFLSIAINSLNTNPYLIGMLMLLLNLGGRFLSMELTQKQEEFLQQRWLRPLIFFTVIFVATRNLAVAFWMTLALFLILWILANEKSPFCIIPGWRMGEDPAQTHQQYEKNMNIIKTIHNAKVN